MSLKYVHLLFITLSTILTWLFAIWCLMVVNRQEAAPIGFLVGGIAAALLGCGMVAYGFWFFKKAKRLVL